MLLKSMNKQSFHFILELFYFVVKMLLIEFWMRNEGDFSMRSKNEDEKRRRGASRRREKAGAARKRKKCRPANQEWLQERIFNSIGSFRRRLNG